MKILWISFYGSWTLPLLYAIKSQNDIHIIVPQINGKDYTQEKSGIMYYNISFREKELLLPMSRKTYKKFQQVIDKINPDIIHVHGTEKNIAQIQNFQKDIPIVISIQGILLGYQQYSYNFLDLKKVHRFRSLKNYLGFGGVKLMNNRIKKGINYEKDIFRKGQYFIGRTLWDRAYVNLFNPNAIWYNGEELLRDDFYKSSNTWNLDECQRHTIFMPSGINPIKGAHHAIEAVALLKKYYPNVTLHIPGLYDDTSSNKRLISPIWGEEYVRFIKHLIKANKLDNNIVFLPRLSAMDMAKKMQQSHVFLSPSSIDNSPNSIGEAMMIGTPIVSTYVGGVPSFLTDESTALLSPSGDSRMIAFQIKRIFENDILATNLSKKAHLVALQRHDKEKTAIQYIDIYTNVINHFKNESNTFSS